MRFIKSQKGGVELPALSNPASGPEILSGYQGINGAGGLVEGSHVCAGLDETTADATATSGDIMSGKTAYSQGKKLTGSHTCQTLTQMTNDATAGAEQILAGYSAYSKGVKVEGSAEPKTKPAILNSMTDWNTNTSTWTKTVTGNFVVAVFNKSKSGLQHFAYCIDGVFKVLNATSSSLTITYSEETLTLKSTYGGYDMKVCLMTL